MQPTVTDRQTTLSVTVGCKNSWSNRDVVWGVDSVGLKEPHMRLGSRSTTQRDKFEGKMLSAWLMSINSSSTVETKLWRTPEPSAFQLQESYVHHTLLFFNITDSLNFLNATPPHIVGLHPSIPLIQSLTKSTDYTRQWIHLGILHKIISHMKRKWFQLGFVNWECTVLWPVMSTLLPQGLSHLLLSSRLNFWLSSVCPGNQNVNCQIFSLVVF